MNNKKTWQHTVNRNLKEQKSSTSNIFSLILTMSGLSAKVRDEHAPNCILKSRAKEKQTANDEIYDLTTLRTITEIIKTPNLKARQFFKVTQINAPLPGDKPCTREIRGGTVHTKAESWFNP